MNNLIVNLNGNELQDLLFVKKTIFGSKCLSLTNIGREANNYMLSDLERYFTTKEINDSYLFERRVPNSLLKNTNGLGKKYIIVFTSKENVNKFKKYGFKVVGRGNHKVFGDEYCMRKLNEV